MTDLMSTTNNSDNNLQEAHHKRLADLERQAYQLNILNESIRELTHLEDQEEILEKFLLILLGAVGASKGFVLKLEQYGKSVQLEARGFDDVSQEGLRQSGSAIYSKFFSHLDSLEDMLPKQVRLVSINEVPEADSHYIPWPGNTMALVQWTLSAKCYGFIGLGAKINGEDFLGREVDFLLSMAEVFMDALKLARSSEQVKMLNKDLITKNQQLTSALAHAQKAQTDLDRQLFHFRALSETSRELSGIFDKKKLMDSFLLMAQGTLSAKSGFMMLFDMSEDSLIMVRRGDKTKDLHKLDESSIKKFILSFYPSPACFSLSDFKVQSIQEDHLSVRSLNMPLDIGIVFSLDENYFGIMGFCSKITESEFSQDEEEILTSLTRSFLVSLENVLSFEIIQKLNLDLGRRNYELSRTIDELRQTRDSLNVLQKTKNRISSLIQGEMLRLERVNVLDFVFIIVITLVLSLTYNISSPGGTSPVPETWTFTAQPSIEADWAVLKHRNNAAIFVDARPNEFYSQERIAGAVSLPLNLFDFVYMMRFSSIDPQKEIIVYGRNISRRYDEKVAHELALRGHKNVLILEGGLKGWKKMNLPVEP
ncbi:MAG: rhodanese-like domain-containing protein [Desulfonatronovibrio sp. MSAO_Bac4]|nr:MAG: rhodanese-like domain-containing protein [Desulfonatronovibrio sp. MSAO_Bac4]